jgi:hypothetical protein
MACMWEMGNVCEVYLENVKEEMTIIKMILEG